MPFYALLDSNVALTVLRNFAACQHRYVACYNIDKSHFKIIIPHVDIIYLACRRQKITSKFQSKTTPPHPLFCCVSEICGRNCNKQLGVKTLSCYYTQADNKVVSVTSTNVIGTSVLTAQAIPLENNRIKTLGFF